jgi:hypothetical protein
VDAQRRLDLTPPGDALFAGHAPSLFGTPSAEDIARHEAVCERYENARHGLPTDATGEFAPDPAERRVLEHFEQRDPALAACYRNVLRDEYIRALRRNRRRSTRVVPVAAAPMRQRRGSCGRPRARGSRKASSPRAGPSEDAEGDDGDGPSAPDYSDRLTTHLNRRPVRS